MEKEQIIGLIIFILVVWGLFFYRITNAKDNERIDDL